MILSSATYTVFNFTAALAVSMPHLSQEALLYPGSALVGCGAAVLWTAQGAYVSAIAKDGELDSTHSVFTAIFSLNGIVGFGVLFLCFQMGDTRTALWALLGLSGMATASFMFLVVEHTAPQVPVATELQVEAQGKQAEEQVRVEEEGTIVGLLWATLAIFQHRPTVYLAPLCFLFGSLEGFFWGIVALQMRTSLIPIAFIGHGVASAAVSRLAGDLAELYGRHYVLCPLLLLSLISCTAVGFAMKTFEDGTTADVVFVVSTVGFGAVDLPCQGLARSMVTDCAPPGQVVPAMGFVVFMLSGGVVTAFLYGPWVPVWGQVAIMDAITLAALLGVLMVPSEILLKCGPGSDPEAGPKTTSGGLPDGGTNGVAEVRGDGAVAV